jgi:putative hemolysin
MGEFTGQMYQHIGQVLVMLVLLAGSAFFSSAETAFFNLSRRQVESLRRSKHKLEKLAGSILRNPSKLLGGLLFANMIVNTLYFACSSVLIMSIESKFGLPEASLAAVITFTVLLLFGEILPKTAAYSRSQSVSVVFALPVYVSVRLLEPVLWILRFAITDPLLRLLVGTRTAQKGITLKEFKILLSAIRQRGDISADQSRVVTEVVEFGALKVKDCLKPRVDMAACEIHADSADAKAIMLENGLITLPVYNRDIDRISGVVTLRRLLLEENKALSDLVERTNFVPEQKTVESLLEFFRKSGTNTAIVVDEYGGISGSANIEDIVEEILGPISGANAGKSIKSIGPREYMLNGRLPIHDWAESFDIDMSEQRITTIGGLVTSLLGRIPEAGDVARLGNLKFTVENVKRNRVESVKLTLESVESDE